MEQYIRELEVVSHLKLLAGDKNLSALSLLKLRKTHKKFKKLIIKLQEAEGNLMASSKLRDIADYRNFDTHSKLLCLQTFELEEKLEIHINHFGMCKFCSEVINDFEDFYENYSYVMSEFCIWAERGGDI